jgi:hypothetical protein
MKGKRRNNLWVLEEDDYCKRSDFLKFYHPDVTLEDINLIRDMN